MSTDTFKAEVLPKLNVLVLYSPDGTLFWRKRAREWFTSDKACATWNGRYAGQPALNKIGNHGYRCGTICGVGLLAHRVVWALHYGCWPDECDHIDGVRHHNRIENLRNTDKSGNQRNTKRRIDNTSGHVGVYRRSDSGRWGACIGHGGRLLHLGTFETRGAAIVARKSAEAAYGFSPAHGRQVRILSKQSADR